MKFSQFQSECFVPDSIPSEEALSRTTHLGIGAHPDDLEFMALHGILECFQQDDLWFGGVTCTDGAGSARCGPYADYNNEEMVSVRVTEQRTAAVIGEYSFIAQLMHSSAASKTSGQRSPMVDDLVTVLSSAQAKVVYTHNPFDKHPSHVGVFHAVIESIERLPRESRPKQLLGCEGWRGLDWIPDELKIIHSLDAHPNLASSLNGIFDSQITGGKRYDLAVEGRRLANATFFDPNSVDAAHRAAYAIDLSVLIESGSAGLTPFVEGVLERFRSAILV